ncbi:MAG: hypothetical protein FWE57_08115 [Chitinispirillia bacterium]|nr:hypothetical protein [Chitinispirillia bacterium]
MNCIFNNNENYLALTLVCLIAFMAPAQTGTPNTDWYTANPSAKTFTIRTADELAGLAQIVNGTWGGMPAYFNFRNCVINLADDVDLSDYGADYNDGAGWTPIGINNIYNGGSFSGTFDGNGNIITGLYINRTGPNESRFVGLFGYIMGDTAVTAVRNLGVIDADITASVDRAGAVAGHISSGSVINCYSTGTVTGKNDVGGLIGFINGGAIINCYSAASVEGHDNVGGVAGYVNGSTGSVTNSYSTGSVNGNNSVGGVAGYIYGGTITDCCFTGIINGNHHAGDIVGRIFNEITAGLDQKNKHNIKIYEDIPPVNTFSGKFYHGDGDTNKFTAGPNPAVKHSGSVNFFWQGAVLQSGTLFVYEMSGNLVKKIIITGNCSNAIDKSEKRNIGKWDLTNTKGQPVCTGTYVIKGTITAINGDKERISLVIGVR